MGAGGDSLRTPQGKASNSTSKKTTAEHQLAEFGHSPGRGRHPHHPCCVAGSPWQLALPKAPGLPVD